MGLIFSTPLSISGSGSTPVLGPWLEINLDTIPAWETAGATGLVYYRNLGAWHWATGGKHFPSTVIHWAESLFGVLPDFADTLYWELAPGVSGTLAFGKEALKTA